MEKLTINGKAYEVKSRSSVEGDRELYVLTGPRGALVHALVGNSTHDLYPARQLVPSRGWKLIGHVRRTADGIAAEFA